MKKPHLYAVVLEHRRGGHYVGILAAPSRLKAIAAVRRIAAFEWDEPMNSFTLCRCDRIDRVDGYDVILRPVATEAKVS